MVDLIGILFLSIVCIVSFIISLQFKKFAKIILVALIFRILLLLINNNIFYLPDGDMDALNFEALAWQWSQNGFYEVFSHFKGPDTYFLSFLIAIPYSLLGRSMMMAQSFSILLGIVNILLVCLIARKLWNNQIAIKAGWLAALFPSVASYSVLVMRETYIAFFLLLALLGIIYFIKQKNLKSFFLLFFGFLGATFFHNGSIIGLLAFICILLLIYIKKLFELLLSGKINLNILLILIIFLYCLQLFVSHKKVNRNFDFDRITRIIINTKVKGDASYPEFLKVNSKTEFIYKAPLRMIYFVLSPFPWNVKKPSHLIGLLDSLLYFYLTFLIFRNFKNIKNDIALKVILIVLLAYFFVFGLGVGNFGTAIRHRVKFVFWMILLAAPLIQRFVLFKEKIIKSKKI